MIFCNKCGRYYNDGTPSCGACGANLATHGDVCLQGRSIKGAAVPDYLSRTPVPGAPRPVRATAPVNASPLVGAGRRESAGVAVLEPPTKTNLEGNDAVDPVTDPVFDRNKFLLRQK